MATNLKCFLFSVMVLIFTGCNLFTGKDINNQKDARNWQQQFDEKLPLLGHRNWILIVDKAFPEQNGSGFEYIYVNEHLLPVLSTVLNKINKSAHVKPIIYQDKELNYITEDQAGSIKAFLNNSKTVLGLQSVHTMLHDSIFRKLDTESKLFTVLVIKTNETIPYTSVFLQLDCAYWNNEKETQLRRNMADKSISGK